jgi:hypothetical protein
MVCLGFTPDLYDKVESLYGNRYLVRWCSSFFLDLIFFSTESLYCMDSVELSCLVLDQNIKRTKVKNNPPL